MNARVDAGAETGSHAQSDANTSEHGRPTLHSGEVDVASALEAGTRWTLFQKSILVLTALAVVLDGLDNQLLGFAIPAIAAELDAGPDRFASVIAISLVMMSVGTALGGVLGDALGRKSTMIASMILFATGTGAAGMAQDLNFLAWSRWLAALGLGACMPNATAMLADYTPRAHRSLAVTLGIIGVPMGGLIAGFIAAPVLAAGNWRLLFYIGAALPLLLAAVMIVALPEAPQFLARDPKHHRRLRDILAKCDVSIHPDTKLTSCEKPRRSAAVTEIFAARFRAATFGIWLAFISCLFAIYLVFSWAPSLLQRSGFGSAAASLGLASFNFGGMAGALLGGWLMDRFGPIRPLALNAICAVGLGILLGVVGLSATNEVWTIVGMGALGVFVNGSQPMLFALAANVYHADCRGAGVGIALAIGRVGAVGSSFAGPLLLGTGAAAYFGTIAGAMLLTVLSIAIVAYAKR